MRERLTLSWRLARALLSKQRRASWCGLSFPLSWPRYSMGVRGVWEKPVWKGREEVCIYLCWWGMIPTLICLQTSSWTALRAAAAIRSLCQPRRVQRDARTVCTCRDKRRKRSSIQWNCSRCRKVKQLQHLLTFVTMQRIARSTQNISTHKGGTLCWRTENDLSI